MSIGLILGTTARLIDSRLIAMYYYYYYHYYYYYIIIIIIIIIIVIIIISTIIIIGIIIIIIVMIIILLFFYVSEKKNLEKNRSMCHGKCFVHAVHITGSTYCRIIFRTLFFLKLFF